MTEEKDKTNESSINNENIQKLKNLLNNDKSDLFEILSLKKKVKFDDKNEENKINNEIWQKQYSLLFPPKDSKKISKPNISQLNVLISSAEEYNIKNDDKLTKIKLLQERGNNLIKEISKIKSIDQLNILKSNVENINLDLNEYFIQREMKIKSFKDAPPENPVSKNENNEQNLNLFLTTKESLNLNKPKHKRKSYKKKEDSYEEDFIKDSEDSGDSELMKNIHEINKKESSSFKRYANALQMEAENFVNSRSRRNINKKRDDDYVYDDDLNKEGNENDELGLDSGDDKNDVDIVILHKRKKKENEGDEEYSEDSYDKIKEKKEQKLNEKLLNKKVKRTDKKINITNTSSNKILPPQNSDKEIKAKTRQKALTTLTDILKNNKYLMEQGLDFVTSLATKVEEDLAKAYPQIDFDYQKTLSNMNKTLKEMANYKRINQLVIKGKLILFKMAKFTYGEKFIQKLKKVEEGNQGKKPINKQKSKINNPSLDLLNKFSDENNPIQNKDSLNMSKMVSGISYKSGFSQSSFNDERNNENDNENYNNMNEDSLESIEEQNNIKFSPGGNNHKLGEGSGNIQQILDHTYDPFSPEKINSSNLLFPILYDPELANDEDSMSEDNISNPDIEDNNNNEIIEPPHKGSVLRLYHGKIKLNHNVIDKVSLYSFNKYEKFLKFPSFEKELVLPSKAKSNEVIPYCLKQLNNNSKIGLFGWIEPEPNKNNKNIEINKFSDLIEEFDRNEKCSCLVENKIKLYVFSLGEKDEKLYKKIIKKEKFINKRFMEGLNSGNKFLVFVLLANNDDLENEVVKNKKKMSPEIITQLDFSESEDEDENLLVNKKNKNLSTIMEKEEENIQNNSMKKNNNNEENNKEDENNDENEDDEDNLIDKEENEKLRIILEQNDFNTINEYIENNFKDLPLEEMANKLQRFTAENREKLLNIIKSYSEKFSQNDNQMDVDDDNNNNNNNNINQMQSMNNMGIMNQMNMNQNYGINMYQNDQGMNQMYLGGINNMNNMNSMGNIQQQNNNINNINPNLQQMYYNQGMNIYNNYNPNFK